MDQLLQHMIIMVISVTQKGSDKWFLLSKDMHKTIIILFIKFIRGIDKYMLEFYKLEMICLEMFDFSSISMAKESLSFPMIPLK